MTSAYATRIMRQTPCHATKSPKTPISMGGGKLLKTNNLQSHKPCIFILLLAFLAAFPFAAKAQVVVTHSTTPTASGVGEHTTLDAALKACNLLSGTYTITLTADCNIIRSRPSSAPRTLVHPPKRRQDIPMR